VTERLYRSDSHLLEFEARVVDVVERGGRRALLLDRSAFHPTGGGQPFDTGTLGRYRVVDVESDGEEGERVLHFIESPPGEAPPAIGATLAGKVDAARRRDHLQQHSGQHILSQAFVRAAKLETGSFHLGAETATIDLDPGASDEVVARALEIANDVVFSDRPMRVHEVTPEELSKFAIRRQTFHGPRIRLIEIEGFDVSTCGGTHAQRAGEVGLIAVKSVERGKGMHRVEFVCGGRALREYRRDRRLLSEIGRRLSTGGEQLLAQVERLAESNQAMRKRVKQLYEIAADVQARELLSKAERRGALRVVCEVVSDLSFEEAQLLARKVTSGATPPDAGVPPPAGSGGSIIVLLGIRDGDGGRLLFARSNDPAVAAIAMGPLVKQVAERFGGKGGGAPNSAQAAIAKGSDLAAALAAARELLPS
jgi:alanyl-tRNA synthetase